MLKIISDRANFKAFIVLDNMDKNVIQGMRLGLWRVGKLLEKTSKDGIKNPPKTGRIYKYKGRNLRASAPGEYPRNRSGNLRRSVNFNVQGNQKMIFGANADYAPFLELGTVKMKKRPFLFKSIKKKQQKSLNLLRKSLNDELVRS